MSLWIRVSLGTSLYEPSKIQNSSDASLLGCSGYSFQFSAVLDVHLSGRYAVLTTVRLDLLDHVVAFDEPAEDHMLVIQPFGLAGGYEERGA